MVASKTYDAEREAREYAESIIETIREPLIVLDDDLKVITASRAFYDFFKVSSEETEGQLIYHIGDKHWDIPELRKLLEVILPDNNPFNDYEVEADFRDIGRRTMLLNARQLERKAEKEQLILLAIEDITERKRAQNLLSAASEERYRHLFEHASDGLLLLEKNDGRIEYTNPAARTMLGWSKEELVGRTVAESGFPDNIASIREILQILERDGIFHYQEAALTKANGEVIFGDIYMVDRSELVQCNVREITERKQAEEEQQQALAKLSDLYENAPCGYHSLDENGVFIQVNNTELSWLGYTRDEIIGKKFTEILTGQSQEKFNKHFPVFKKQGWGNNLEFELVRKDGTILPAVLLSSVVVKDSAGNYLYDKGMLFDITERKRAEQEQQRTLDELHRTQYQIIEQERQRALSTMASGIAHDFNNALSPIQGFTRMLLDKPEKLEDREKVIQYLRHIDKAASSAAETIRRMRKFYRPQEEAAFSQIDLNSLISDAVAMTKPRWKETAAAEGKHIDIQTLLGDITNVSGNEAELNDMITNLIFNAVDAMPEGGQITVSTCMQEKHVLLEFSDNGTGMPEETKRRCLEPFYTEKGKNGSGLGLAAIERVIHGHNGELSIESTEGEGTTFRITLPCSESEEVTLERETKESVPTVRILVVEDEESQRAMLQEMLTTEGHKVDVAVDGGDALRKFDPEAYDLVITDRAMGQMDGDALAQKVNEKAPDIPIIMLTGFGDMMDAANKKVEAVDDVLAKPLNTEKLAESLAKVISGDR